MRCNALNFEKKPRLFDDRWAPGVIAAMIDSQFKPVNRENDFVRHDARTDETCILPEDGPGIEFHDSHVDLKAGETYLPPRGAVHRPREVGLPRIDARPGVNRGDAGGGLGAQIDAWI